MKAEKVVTAAVCFSTNSQSFCGYSLEDVRPVEGSTTRAHSSVEETSGKRRKRVKKLRSKMYMDEDGAMGERETQELTAHYSPDVCVSQ